MIAFFVSDYIGNAAVFLHLLTFQTPIYIWDFGFSQNPQYKKGGLSVKSNRCLMTFKDTDPKGSAFEMSKGVIIQTGVVNGSNICNTHEKQQCVFIYIHDAYV